MKWIKKGFEEFSKGTLGNGGQNIYVSKGGILQRIFNFDVNGDGYPDLPIANSHSMNERPDIYVFDSLGQKKPLRLPSEGSFDAVFADITGNGTDDLIIAAQHNGVHCDTTALIYFGSERGLSEKYKYELMVPNSIGVCAGDFKGAGKKQLAFISGEEIRVFSHNELGVIESSFFDTLDIKGLSIAAGDLDGDGYDDLYVMHAGSAELSVYWGGPDGLSADNKTDFGLPMELMDSRGTSTTAGRKFARWILWKCNVIKAMGKTVTYRVENYDTVVLESWEGRVPHEELRIRAVDFESLKHEPNKYRYGGVMHVASGDLKNCGDSDIVIAASTDCDVTEDLIVLWQSENYSMEKATRIPVRCARTLSIGPIDKSGENYLFVAQGSTRHMLTVDASVYKFEKDGKGTLVSKIPTEEAVCVMSGKTYDDGRYQIVAINHEGNELLGLDNISVFLGGEDGYCPERKLDFPACAATDVFLCDLNDDGRPEVLISNCGENAPFLNPGAAVYWNGENGFDIEKVNHFDTRSCHGFAVGDFRKSGYLDVIMGGIHDRRLLVFEGGPDGYDYKKPKVLTMGPEPEKFVPFPYDEEEKYPSFNDEERELDRKYGQVRWLFSADFNGDGYLDLFVSQICSEHSFIFWGGPDGFSTDRMQVLACDGAASANAADLDGDGYLDLIVAGHQSLGYKIPNERGHITVYWGGPDGYKENRKTKLPSYCCNAVTVGDFNNDGVLDIYGTAYNNGRCRDIESRIYFGSEDGVFSLKNYQNLFNNSGCGAIAGDFNGDGYTDLLVISHKREGNHTAKSFIYWGGEDGINQNRFTALPSQGPHGGSSVDIGNIMDRSDSEYYYSEVYELPEDRVAKHVSWVAENGKKTYVKMQLRCGEIPEAVEMANWSRPVDCGMDIEKFNLRGYIQYRLELFAKCGCGTPRVSEVTIDFE